MQKDFQKTFMKMAFISVISGGFLYANTTEPPNLECTNVELRIHQEENEIRIDQNDILRLVIENLNKTCEVFKDKMKLDVSYSSALEEEQIKTTIFTSQENKIAKVSISLKFSSAFSTQQAKGMSSLQVSKKKVLQITKGPIISQKDQEYLIQKAFNAAWQNAKEMLNRRNTKIHDNITRELQSEL